MARSVWNKLDNDVVQAKNVNDLETKLDKSEHEDTINEADVNPVRYN